LTKQNKGGYDPQSVQSVASKLSCNIEDCLILAKYLTTHPMGGLLC